jgi:hypothetical protein
MFLNREHHVKKNRVIFCRSHINMHHSPSYHGMTMSGDMPRVLQVALAGQWQEFVVTEFELQELTCFAVIVNG